MTSFLFGLFGAGGHGRESMQFARAAISRHPETSVSRSRVVFVDDRVRGTIVDGTSVLSEDEFFAVQSTRFFNVAIADGRARQRVSERCLRRGATAISLVAENAIVSQTGTIGEGSMFAPFSMSTSNARIGRFFLANMYSYVAHDCEIGDFVTFAPAVKCNGNVIIEDFVSVGTGAILRPGAPTAPLRIGSGSVIGMGAVVTRDVAPGSTVVGNPARPLEK